MNRQFFRFETRPTDRKKVAGWFLTGICVAAVLALFVRHHLARRATLQIEEKNRISSGRIVDRDASDGYVTVRGKDGELHDLPAWMFSDPDARQDYP